MKRIMIIGCGGSGKSTLARQLGEKLGLPVYHLDRLFWQPGWTTLPKTEWRSMQEQLCAKQEWIIDGNYNGTMDIRFAAADTIIFLDVPTYMSLAGAVQRFFRFRGRTRPDMSEGCPERLEWNYIKWILSYRRNSRSGILKRLKEQESNKRVIILSSRRELREFLTGNNIPVVEKRENATVKSTGNTICHVENMR